MKTLTFRCIVFFGPGDLHHEAIKKSFAQYSFIKIFRTNNIDELVQILNQSVLTAILASDLLSVARLTEEDIVGIKEAGIRIYFLDESGDLTRKEIADLSLKRISTLRKTDFKELKTKLDLFILGKFQLSSNKERLEVNTELMDDSEFKKSYFSHFKFDNGNWSVVVSTHEQEKEIETIFQRSWTVYCLELLDRAGSIHGVENDPKFSDRYHAIIFPHHSANGKKSISIIHIKKDEKDFDNMTKKALEFLSKI